MNIRVPGSVPILQEAKHNRYPTQNHLDQWTKGKGSRQPPQLASLDKRKSRRTHDHKQKRKQTARNLTARQNKRGGTVTSTKAEEEQKNLAQHPSGSLANSRLLLRLKAANQNFVTAVWVEQYQQESEPPKYH
mmetsp:Transcript_538/g.1276  ORF Transcript_538/g.1276 Transcript_538/m.1276 type:complete len:133 (+) Transcript_538:924-1322(+)